MRSIARFASSSVVVLVALSSGRAPAQEAPPSLVYGDSRTSSGWIDTPKGRVAVDEGVAWKGVKVYLTLTWDLVGTDAGTGALLWIESVGAFWNEIGFKEVEAAPGRKDWAVELRPGPRARQGADERQHHDLKTGRIIGAAESRPAGKVVDLAGSIHGRWSSFEKPVHRLLGTEDEWKALVARMFEGVEPPPRLPVVDFARSVVLVIGSGETWNCKGIGATAWEDDRRILVRLEEHTFQTSGPDGGGKRVRPWGIVVLPRRDPFKPVVVERNAQNLIGGPAIWKTLCRFEAFGDGTPPGSKRL
jgi:hypothetical protein